MRLLITFARRYPWRSSVMLLALLLAGFMESIGLSMLLPLIGITVGTQSGERQLSAAENGAADSTLGRLVADAFSALDISPTMGLLLAVIITAVILKSAMMLLAKKQVGYTVARVATDLRLELLRGLMVSRWQYFLKQPLGGLANAMATETARASKAYMSGVLMTAEFFQALVYFLMAFLVSWKATLISLTAGFAILYLVKRFLKKARKAGIRQTELLKSMLALLTDTLQSIKPLKAMARENVSDLLLEKKTKRLNKALQKQVLNKEFLKAFHEILMTVFLAAGLYILLIHWQMSLASVMVLAFLVARLLKRLNKVQERYQEMIIFESAYWSLKDVIKSVQKECEKPGGDLTPELKQAVRMEHVHFAYDDHCVLRDVSLNFPMGRITAIVGPSGSGKTTLVDLTTGLLRPQQGEVWIDDMPLAQVNLKSWRRMIGYIPQETILLHDTVLSNVTLGDPALSETDAEQALRAAGAWEFVNAMPLSMQSIVGERGGKLSGGQRQRIAIARALVHRPKLLILDEATSGLDPESEAAVCDTLQQLRGKLTILAISHQSALVKIADKAYRIEDGKILQTENSPHPDLPTPDIDT
ncbi:MAG: ABC transporter ATP-binding protein, partial [Deltaproteobacteria bacterium]|nr:ABC transporter ATP-binding protein [Deltaproteobacteria bacterium]